jgi:hypothetical protein
VRWASDPAAGRAGHGTEAMATINTVLGPADTAELGLTFIHEHLVIG